MIDIFQLPFALAARPLLAKNGESVERWDIIESRSTVVAVASFSGRGSEEKKKMAARRAPRESRKRQPLNTRRRRKSW